MDYASDENAEDSIVISGLAGRYPKSENVREFSENLYNKVDMIGDYNNRIQHFFPGHPRRFGFVPRLEKFDAQAFSIPPKLSGQIDPQGRVLLEHTIEAIYDAGISPNTLMGSNTGVFVGCFNFDALEHWLFEKTVKIGMASAGNALYSLANRLSFVLDLKGPSIGVDTACSSSMYALNQAFAAIENGDCDAAFVAGTNAILNPFPTEDFYRGGVVAKTGISSPFDKDAIGYVRAEAMSVVFLQKRKDAKRVYATVLNCKANNDGYKKSGPAVPSAVMQKKLYEKVYGNLKVDPTEVDYVEAHATSTQVGDRQELSSIDEYFCKNRTTPLKVGSVKSNIGHAEGAAGITSLTKALLIFENQKLIPNLNIPNPRDDCSCLVENRIKIVEDVEEFKGKYIGISSFGVLGANAHVLLKGNEKTKINFGLPKDDLPRLVVLTGRTDEGVNYVLDDILTRPLDAEFVALINNSQKETSVANGFRGFGIYTKTGENFSECVERDVYNFKDSKRKVVFVYSGVGSQWLGMGKDLMKIPSVNNAIEFCHKILETKGVDLKKILTSKDPEIFEDSLNTFVGVAAIQIGLTDMLKTLSVEPDYIIGHSVGELACAYADGGLTREEMILAAYSRGMAIKEVKRGKGAMAAIGMGFKELKKIIPKFIEIACHNSSDSCTISGLIDDVKAFVQETKEKDLLAKEISSSGIAFHSSHIAKCGPILLKKLKSIIINPKPRTPKWISTSVPREKWATAENALSSAEYHTNNLLNPVLFEEGVSMLPSNALIIEIAPHGLLQPILKKSLANAECISLTKRDVEDSVSFLLKSLGKIFEHGVDLDINKLYPTIQFPVSRGTPMISPLVKWNHENDHLVPAYDPATRSDKRNLSLTLSDPKYEFMKGHAIDNRVLLPATGYLYLVWETFAMMKSLEHTKLAVTFEDVRFQRATFLSRDQDTHLTIIIQRGSGRFEIVEGSATVIDGLVKVADSEPFANIEIKNDPPKQLLSNEDFYKELQLRGYQYTDKFQSVLEAKASDSQGMGKVKWEDNYVSFTDGMLQLLIVANDSRDLFLPTSIRKLTINPQMHEEAVNKIEGDEKVLNVVIDPYMKVMQSGGIEIWGLDASFINRRRLEFAPILEVNRFVPHLPTSMLSQLDMAKFCVQLILEIAPALRMNLVEIDAKDEREPIIESFAQAFEKLPLISPELTYLTEKEIELKKAEVKNEDLSTFSKINILIKSNCIQDPTFLTTVCDKLDNNGYVLSRENSKLDNVELPENFKCLACITMEDECVYLVQYTKPQSKPQNQPAKEEPPVNIVEIPSGLNDLSWINELKKMTAKSCTIVHSRSDKNSVSGVLGLVKCLRKESKGLKLRCFFINDESAPEFNLDLPLYKSQNELNLPMNVYQDGQWGTYRHLEVPQESETKPRTDHVFVKIQVRGDLTSLTWLTGPLNIKDDNLVEVHYAALNFRDVLVATKRIILDFEFDNRIKRQYVCGYEFSGITRDGKRVMGLVNSKAFGTHVPRDESRVLEIPDSWSLEEAATVPVVYITVYMAFFKTSQIEKGRSILIHAGCGGIGLAAIRVALAYGLEVFTTCSSEEKRNYLLSEFPELKPDRIGNTRDSTFEQMVMTQTKGKGVDYVLNSLSEDKMQASLRCVADNGYFLEVGKFDMLVKNKIHLNHFLRGITFRAVLINLNDLIRNEAEGRKIMKIMEDDMKNGIIKPLKTTVFDAPDVEKAFRFLGGAKNIGKVLIKVRENEDKRESLSINVFPRIYFKPDLCYIIPGGMGGFGMELADWLVMRECKNLCLSSSRGITNTYQTYRIKIWESYGVQVLVSTADITTESGCRRLINEAKILGPVGGIFNLAAVLRDGTFDKLDETQFIECLKPKALATQYLDELSRKLCPELQHFVVFSSISCGRGNAGQSNYGMANSITERIVEKRCRDGLPGKAIQWGPIGDVGMFANLHKGKDIKDFFGMKIQSILSCLDVLDKLLTCKDPVVSSMVVAEKIHGLKNSKNMLETLMSAMGIPDIKAINMDVPISELGMDSLVSAEIQQTLEREFGISMTFQELKSTTLNQLQAKIKGAKSTEKSENVTSFMDSLWKNLQSGYIIEKTIEEFQVLDQEKAPKLLLIPGIIGGLGKIWSELPYSVYILHHIHIYAAKSFNEIYYAIEQEVLDLFKDDDNFTIVGYSFGSAIGLRLCEKFEAMGKTGKLILIDGSPKFMKSQITALLPDDPTDDDIQNLIFSEFTTKTHAAIADEVMRNIWLQATWEKKVEEFVRLIPDAETKEFIKQNLEAIMNRIKIILNEDDLTFSISDKTPVTLIKSLAPFEANIIVDADYGLNEYCKHEIRIETIEGDHYSIIDNSQIVEIINSI